MVVSSGRPRVGKIGRAVRKQLRELEPGGMKAVSAALAEATADLADSAWRAGKSRDDSPWRALWGLAWAHGVHADL